MDVAFNTLYKPVFFQQVPPLQNIVISKMVQHTWHNELSNEKLQGNLSEFLIECAFLRVAIDLRCQKVNLIWNVSWEETQMSRYIFEVEESLSEQSKIQRNIELCALNLSREFEDWIRFHGIVMYHDPGMAAPVVELIYNFDEFVYDVYGRIDYEATAKNLMVCVEVTLYQKFVIACLYCFEEEIKQLWPLVQVRLQQSDFSEFKDELVQYWVIRMRDEQNGVFVQYDPITMFSQHSTTYSAMKYFWKNITTFDEKVNCIGSCFETENVFGMLQCVKYWFPSMKDDFLKCVLSRYGTLIMINLIQRVVCQKFMLSFWQHTSASDMFDGYQFIEILERINAIQFRDFRLICKVLWNNASTKLKMHALNNYQIKDSVDPLHYLIMKSYAQNIHYFNNGRKLIVPSDWIYYPAGCKCNDNPERENCRCKTFLK